MDAKVTLTLTPQEFDLIRRALDSHRATLENLAKNAAPSDMRATRAGILTTGDLIAKLS